MTKENLVKAPAERKRRNPLEGKNKLRVKGKDPAYEYRVVNVVDDRINDLIDQDWEIDTDEGIRVGDIRVEDTSRLGTVRQLSVGGGMKAVVMRKKKEWYDEDQQIKQDAVKKQEEAMRAPNPDGQYGKVDITRK